MKQYDARKQSSDGLPIVNIISETSDVSDRVDVHGENSGVGILLNKKSGTIRYRQVGITCFHHKQFCAMQKQYQLSKRIVCSTRD